MNRSRKRFRRPREVEEPFAGLQQPAGPISLTVYGITPSMFEVDELPSERDGLVALNLPSSGGNDEQQSTFVDRYDARLLLDPSELASIDTALQLEDSAAPHEFSEEAELDAERWRDLFGPSFSSEEEEDGGRLRRWGYGAVPYGYGSAGAAAATAGAVFEPPPPPLRIPAGADVEALLEQLANQKALPIPAKHYAVMRRAAEFVQKCGAAALALLRELQCGGSADAAFFAFLDPQHVWHDFFFGLLERLPSPEENSERSQAAAAAAAGTGTGGKSDSSPAEESLADLLGQYGEESDDLGRLPQYELETTLKTEEEGGERRNGAPSEAQIRAAMAALIARVQRGGGAALAALARGRLTADPLFEFFAPSSEFRSEFVAAVEGAGELLDAAAASALLAEKEDVVEKAAVVPPWIADRMKKEREGGDATAAAAVLPETAAEEETVEVDEAKKAERRKRARELLQRRRQEGEERKRGQAAARQAAEEQRQRDLAAISMHKRMFLDDDD